MNFADNWARVFVVITFLTFGEAQIIGGIVPNLIAFGLFLGAIGYFAATGKMAEMFGWKNKNKKKFYQFQLHKIVFFDSLIRAHYKTKKNKANKLSY